MRNRDRTNLLLRLMTNELAGIADEKAYTQRLRGALNPLGIVRRHAILPQRASPRKDARSAYEGDEDCFSSQVAARDRETHLPWHGTVTPVGHASRSCQANVYGATYSMFRTIASSTSRLTCVWPCRLTP